MDLKIRCVFFSVEAYESAGPMSLLEFAALIAKGANIQKSKVSLKSGRHRGLAGYWVSGPVYAKTRR